MRDHVDFDGAMTKVMESFTDEATLCVGLAAEMIRIAPTWREYLDACRAYYRARRAADLPVVDSDPYSSGIHERLTPIELDLWTLAREFGIRLAPQYPVGIYMADFADPEKRIVIECDGAEFHDRDRDALRDEAMRTMGWTVYRIPGAAFHCSAPHPLDDYAGRRWSGDRAGSYFSMTARGFVEALATIHYGSRRGYPQFNDEMQMALKTRQSA